MISPNDPQQDRICSRGRMPPPIASRPLELSPNRVPAKAVEIALYSPSYRHASVKLGWSVGRESSANPPAAALRRFWTEYGAPMQSTLPPKPNDDPHDVLVVAPDVVLVAPTDEELSRLARTMRHPSNPQTRTGSDLAAVPPVDTTFRPAAGSVPGRRRAIGRRVARAFAGFLLAAGIGGAAFASWQSYGDTAKQIFAKWAPQFVLTSSPPPENSGLPDQPNPPAIQASAATAASAQPAPPAQAAPEGVAAAAAAQSPDSAQLLQSMAANLATAGQEIEQLKASIAQLKARQEQMSRDIAKASEQNLRPKISAPPPRAAAARPRKPMLPPPQAATAPVLPQAAAPYVPRQAEPQPQALDQPLADPELASVPRPPMPLR